MERSLTFKDFLNEAGDDSTWLNGIRDSSQPAGDEASAASAPNDLGDEVPKENKAIASLGDIKVEFEAAASLAEERAREIPLPPPPQLYNSFNDLFNSLQAYYRNNGAAIVKKSPGNKAKVNGKLIPTYYSIVCDRGARRASQSSGVQKASTGKVNCPFKITASASKKAN